jgi:hypothetical protein
MYEPENIGIGKIPELYRISIAKQMIQKHRKISNVVLWMSLRKYR